MTDTKIERAQHPATNEMKLIVSKLLRGSNGNQITSREIRLEIEQSLNLPSGALKSSREVIMSLINEVCLEIESEPEIIAIDVQNSSTNDIHTALPENTEHNQLHPPVKRIRGVFKKYTTKEKEEIMQMTHKYMLKHSVSKEDLCPNLREPESGRSRYERHSLWLDLALAFPNRFVNSFVF